MSIITVKITFFTIGTETKPWRSQLKVIDRISGLATAACHSKHCIKSVALIHEFHNKIFSGNWHVKPRMFFVTGLPDEMPMPLG
jgi:hypothetical protein